MSGRLTISIGQHSDKGPKEINQDFHGALIPAEPLLGMKGIAIALADGISSSNVSHIAAESAVKSLLTDYYCTSETWSVKTSVQRVLSATNSWLNAQTWRSRHSFEMERDRGYVCTLSALVIKGATAHIFHIGDSRIYRLSGHSLEQLTEDHRVVVSAEQSYLGRALGSNPQVEIDYQAIQIEPGDVFVLATDGVYEHVTARFIAKTIREQAGNLDGAAQMLIATALEHGSTDNLTLQIVRVDELPDIGSDDVRDQLPLPPLLEARLVFDGFRVIREVHASHRSHAYLAADTETDELVVLKIPSTDLRDNPDYLRRFMMEEWVARRINSPHVLKPRALSRRRNYLYVVMEYVEGQTLAQWMIDNPKPDLEAVRGIIEQAAKGIGAFHRMEMLHQDVRPENIMIDKTGTVRIIDFGATKVAGVAEATPQESDDILGTAQYTAPEYFIGEGGSPRADIFSLAVIAYQMLTGKLPYGTQVARTRTKSQQRKLRYRSALDDNRDIPAWLDKVLEKALQPDPAKRYEELSEFVHELRHPNPQFLNALPTPLIERNPLLFWKVLSAILALIVLFLLAARTGVTH